jgi:hypothetical protein
MPEGKSANKDSDPGEDGIEEVEGTDRTYADEVKDRAFDTQVSERLVQTLEYSIASFAICFDVCHVRLIRENRLTNKKLRLNSPEPGKDVDCKHCNSGSAATPASAFLAPGSP